VCVCEREREGERIMQTVKTIIDRSYLKLGLLVLTCMRTLIIHKCAKAWQAGRRAYRQVNANGWQAGREGVLVHGNTGLELWQVVEKITCKGADNLEQWDK
jgi:hypothetical protein